MPKAVKGAKLSLLENPIFWINCYIIRCPGRMRPLHQSHHPQDWSGKTWLYRRRSWWPDSRHQGKSIAKAKNKTGVGKISCFHRTDQSAQGKGTDECDRNWQIRSKCQKIVGRIEWTFSWSTVLGTGYNITHNYLMDRLCLFYGAFPSCCQYTTRCFSYGR